MKNQREIKIKKERAKQLFLEGNNCQQIAIRLGLSYFTVKAWQRKWGLVKGRELLYDSPNGKFKEDY